MRNQITKEKFLEIISRIESSKSKSLDAAPFKLLDILSVEGIETDYETYQNNTLSHDISDVEVDNVKRYIQQNWKNTEGDRVINSYSLKHIIESTMNTYISNGACIKGALLEGYKITNISSPNCDIIFDFYGEKIT